MNTAAFDELIEKTQDNFLEFHRMCGMEPAGSQKVWVETVQKITENVDVIPKRFFCKSGVGCGKTTEGAMTLLWRHWRFINDEPEGVVAAPNEAQAIRGVMKEIRKIVKRTPILNHFFECKTKRVYYKHNYDHAIYVVTASSEDAAKGIHSKGLTIMIDEITGVDDGIVKKLIRTCSQEHNMIFAAYNPDYVTGMTYESFTTDKENWPHNFTLDKLSISKERPDIISPASIEDVRRMYGEDSDEWRVGVMGEFPLEGKRIIIPLGLIEQNKDVSVGAAILSTPDHLQRRVLGIDLARYGNDESVIVYRSGNAVKHMDIITNTEPRDVLVKAYDQCVAWGWGEETVFVVDAIGIGGGAVVALYDRGCNVHEFHPRSKSPEPDTANALSHAWFNLQRVMKQYPTCIPNDPKLLTQLCTREYVYDAKNGYTVESKKQYKDRGFKKSPDRADALVMAWSVDCAVETSHGVQTFQF